MADTLKHRFFPLPLPAIMQDLNHTKHPPAVYYDASITIEQIQRAVHKVAPDKAPGPDAITNRVLKQALPTIETNLQQILQASLNLGHFPQIFKETTTVVLRKPNKPDYSKSKAYRPIALESTISKVFESVIAETISCLTEMHTLLPKHHYGGRPGRSTEDAMMIMLENIYAAWKEGHVFSAIFLDVEGAFNNIHHRRLLHNLQSRRIPKCIIKWLASFLENRRTTLKFNGE
jgi:hypothetical protein